MAERTIAELSIGQDIHVCIKRFTHMDNKLNIHLKPCPAYFVFTMSFRSGQRMSSAAINLMKTNRNFRKLISMWNRYHLNDLQAASYIQQLWLDKALLAQIRYGLSIEAEIVQAGLNNEYAYGSQWLVKEIPDKEIYKTIKAMIAIEEILKPTPRLVVNQEDYAFLKRECENKITLSKQDAMDAALQLVDSANAAMDNYFDPSANDLRAYNNSILAARILAPELETQTTLYTQQEIDNAEEE